MKNTKDLLKADAPGGESTKANLKEWAARAEKYSDSYRERGSSRKSIRLPDTGGPIKLHSTD